MGNLHTLALHGEIDISQRQWIARQLWPIEHLKRSTVTIVDLSDIGYLDTTLLNALMRTRRRLATTRPQNTLRIVAPPPSMTRRLFEITNLDAVFQIFDSVETASMTDAPPPH